MPEFAFGILIGSTGTILAILVLLLVAISRTSTPAEAWRLVAGQDGADVILRIKSEEGHNVVN